MKKVGLRESRSKKRRGEGEPYVSEGLPSNFSLLTAVARHLSTIVLAMLSMLSSWWSCEHVECVVSGEAGDVLAEGEIFSAESGLGLCSCSEDLSEPTLPVNCGSTSLPSWRLSTEADMGVEPSSL